MLKIHLMPDDEKFIEELIASGAYERPSDAVIDAIQLLRERQWVRERKLAELRKEIAKGFEGPPEPFDVEEIIHEGRQRLAKQRRSASGKSK
jgi:antitoxin ParD1/3/4